MIEQVWRHPQAWLYGQELLLVAVGAYAGRGLPRRSPRMAALAGLLALATLCLLLNRAYLPLGYLAGECTISHGRFGFKGPLQAWAALQIPLLWLLGTLGRERLRAAILARSPAPARLAAAALLPALLCAHLTSLRVGDRPALRLEALAADAGTSLTAACLLVLSGSPLVSGAFASGWLYLATVGLSDGEAPFPSIAHVYTSGTKLYHWELAAAWLPAFLLLPAARRRASAGYTGGAP